MPLTKPEQSNWGYSCELLRVSNKAMRIVPDTPNKINFFTNLLYLKKKNKKKRGILITNALY